MGTVHWFGPLASQLTVISGAVVRVSHRVEAAFMGTSNDIQQQVRSTRGRPSGAARAVISRRQRSDSIVPVVAVLPNGIRMPSRL